MSNRERSAGIVKPVFVDNRDGNTLARAITTHLAALRRDGRTPVELCVASCYFNPQGLELIANEARHVPRIRLLGADPTPEALLPRRTPYDPTEPEFTRRRVNQELAQLERGLKRDRDPLGLRPRRGPRDSKPSRLPALGPDRGTLLRGTLPARQGIPLPRRRAGHPAGSADLTRAGLRTNLELVLGHHEDPLVARVEEWFDALAMSALAEALKLDPSDTSAAEELQSLRC